MSPISLNICKLDPLDTLIIKVIVLYCKVTVAESIGQENKHGQ